MQGYSQHIQIPCQGRNLGSNPSCGAKLCVNAETVDSLTAVGVKGSSPLEGRKPFSMVLLAVRVHLHTPSFLQEEQRHGGPKGVGTIKADTRLGYNSIRTDKFQWRILSTWLWKIFSLNVYSKHN